MKLKDSVIVILILMLAFLLNNQSNIKAEGGFGRVTAFDGPSGAVRFFDSADGTLYTYDQGLQKIIRIVQLVELGKPGKEIVIPPKQQDLKFTNPPLEE